MRSKRLVLAYAPFARPTSPPLGVCSLKGYLKLCLPEWEVRVIDLNIRHYQRIVENLSRIPYYSTRDRNTVLSEIVLSLAAQVFCSPNDVQFFYRPDRYTAFADSFQNLRGPAPSSR